MAGDSGDSLLWLNAGVEEAEGGEVEVWACPSWCQGRARQGGGLGGLPRLPLCLRDKAPAPGATAAGAASLCCYVAARSLATACYSQFPLFLGGPKVWTACERQN